MVGRLVEVGPPERALLDVLARDRVALLVPDHAAVAVAPLTAEEPVVGHAELAHRVGQLGHPVLAELVVAVGREVRQIGDEHLALLAARAGDQRDAGAAGDVLRHRRAVADGLVVGVRVHEQQALVHAASLFRERQETARGQLCRDTPPTRLNN